MQKGGGGVWGICRGAGDKSSDQIFCLVQQFFYLGTTLSVALWLKHLAQRAICCYAFSQVRCRLRVADYLARVS